MVVDFVYGENITVAEVYEDRVKIEKMPNR